MQEGQVPVILNPQFQIFGIICNFQPFINPDPFQVRQNQMKIFLFLSVTLAFPFSNSDAIDNPVRFRRRVNFFQKKYRKTWAGDFDGSGDYKWAG